MGDFFSYILIVSLFGVESDRMMDYASCRSETQKVSHSVSILTLYSILVGKKRVCLSFKGIIKNFRVNFPI